MNETPDQVPQPDEIQAEPAKPRRRSQLSYILGVGGGAIAGVFVGIVVAPFTVSVLVLLLVGAVIGGLAPYVGIFALLGSCVGMISWTVLSDIRGDAELAKGSVMLMSVGAGCFVGIIWTIFRAWLRRSAEVSSTEAVEAANERRQMARACLMIGPGIGLFLGLLVGGAYLPILIGCILFGAIAGVALFLALTLSATPWTFRRR